MRFSICPRIKRVKDLGGEFRFRTLRVFTVGEGDRFARTLGALCPELPIESADFDGANVRLSVASVFSSKNEYCALRIHPDRMELRCRDNEGARNAAAILAQLLRRDGEEFCLPCGTAEDWPDAPYRAMMLESSGRSWIPMKRLLLYIREMALARMNVLQFHFMEGPGCTVEMDCYPDWHGYGPDNLKYTKDEIRAMIAYADGGKCFTVTVTDPSLLEKTGGIVQGMSGSPIIQNGKLVGAVTHVLVGDPTRGYGIFIENMLDMLPDKETDPLAA